MAGLKGRSRTETGKKKGPGGLRGRSRTEKPSFAGLPGTTVHPETARKRAAAKRASAQKNEDIRSRSRTERAPTELQSRSRTAGAKATPTRSTRSTPDEERVGAQRFGPSSAPAKKSSSKGVTSVRGRSDKDASWKAPKKGSTKKGASPRFGPGVKIEKPFKAGGQDKPKRKIYRTGRGGR